MQLAGEGCGSPAPCGDPSHPRQQPKLSSKHQEEKPFKFTHTVVKAAQCPLPSLPVKIS